MKIILMGSPVARTTMIGMLLKACGMLFDLDSHGAYNDSRIIEFKELNRRIIDHNHFNIRQPELRKPVLNDEEIRLDMQRFIMSFKTTDWVGWNSSNVCHTLPIWVDVIAPEDTRIIWAVRPPDIELEDMKRVRHITNPEEFLTLMTKLAEMNLKGLKWIKVSYTDFLKSDGLDNCNWRDALKKVIEFVGLEESSILAKYRSLRDLFRHLTGSGWHNLDWNVVY